MPGKAFLADPAAIRPVKELGVTSSEPRGDRAWVAPPHARQVAQEYPGAVPFVAR